MVVAVRGGCRPAVVTHKGDDDVGPIEVHRRGWRGGLLGVGLDLRAIPVVPGLEEHRHRDRHGHTDGGDRDAAEDGVPASATAYAAEQGVDRGSADVRPVGGTLEQVGQVVVGHGAPRMSPRVGSAASVDSARASRLFTVPGATPSTVAICSSVRWA